MQTEPASALVVSFEMFEGLFEFVKIVKLFHSVSRRIPFINHSSNNSQLCFVSSLFYVLFWVSRTTVSLIKHTNANCQNSTASDFPIFSSTHSDEQAPCFAFASFDCAQGWWGFGDVVTVQQ